MQASVGDKLHVHGRTVGAGDALLEVVEVRGERGGPPYLVRGEDGHERLVYPGPDTTVETSGQPPASAK